MVKAPDKICTGGKINNSSLGMRVEAIYKKKNYPKDKDK
jgi:hypothetical protein